MSRIRTIKPEMFTSADFLTLSTEGRLAFIALITLADDYGRVKTDAPHLCHFVGPEVSAQVMENQLQAMKRRGMVQLYNAKHAQYVALVNWPTHQKVDHPRDSNLPEPPAPRERSANPRESSRILAKPREVSARTDRTTDRTTERPNAREAQPADAEDEGHEVPMVNPALDTSRVTAYVREHGWIMGNSDRVAVHRLLSQNVGLTSQHFIDEWEAEMARRPITNPWPVVFGKSGGIAGNVPRVIRRMLREREDARLKDEATAKAIRDKDLAAMLRSATEAMTA